MGKPHDSGQRSRISSNLPGHTLTAAVSPGQIYTHGNNLSELYHHVSRRILPADLGGDGPAHDTQRWADIMIRGPS